MIITIEANPGQHISITIDDAIKVANKLNTSVTMKFNDTSVSVEPHDSPDMVFEKWRDKRESTFQDK